MKTSIWFAVCMTYAPTFVSSLAFDEDETAMSPTKLRGGRPRRLKKISLDIPDSIDDIDLVGLLVGFILLWIVLWCLCNALQCLWNCLGCRHGSGGGRYSAVPNAVAAPRSMYAPPRQAYDSYDNNAPPAYNPDYRAPPSSSSTSYGARRIKRDNTCRNLAWAVCCFECCCRDNRDVDCCEICCCLCMYEMCCRNNDDYY